MPCSLAAGRFTLYGSESRNISIKKDAGKNSTLMKSRESILN
jgi:hypothetical protein